MPLWSCKRTIILEQLEFTIALYITYDTHFLANACAGYFDGPNGLTGMFGMCFFFFVLSSDETFTMTQYFLYDYAKDLEMEAKDLMVEVGQEHLL